MIDNQKFVTRGLASIAVISLVAYSMPVSPAQAQEPATPQTPAPQAPTPTNTPPKESAGKGPQFPKSELKEPKPSENTPKATPGNIDVNNLPGTLTLETAIGYALQLQPSVAQAQASRESQEQRLKISQSQYYPQLNPSYNYQNRYTAGGTATVFNNGVPQTVSTGGTSEFKQLNAIASYTVFDTFGRELDNRQARQSLRGTKFSEEDTRQRVIADVANNYFNVLRTTALVTVSQSQVARAQNTLEVVQAQVEAGLAAQKDTYQAQSDLLNARVSLLQAQNEAQVAQAQLKQSIGLVGGEPLVLADLPAPGANTPVTALGVPPPPLNTSDTDTINALQDTAFRLRPDIASSEKNVEVNKTGVNIARINNGLQANVNVSDGYQFTPEGNNRYTDIQNRTVTLNLSYPLFNGGLTRAQVRQAQASVRNSEAALNGLQQQVAVEVEQAWRTLVQYRAALPAAEAAQQAAQINYDAAVESRREGVGSIVEVIQAQTLLVQAQTQLVQAVYNFYSADASLARAVGYASRISGIVSTAEASVPAGTPPAGRILTQPRNNAGTATPVPPANPNTPKTPTTPDTTPPVNPGTPTTPPPTNPTTPPGK